MQVRLIPHTGEDDPRHSVLHQRQNVFSLNLVVVKWTGNKDIAPLLPNHPLQMPEQFTEKGIGNIRHDDPNGPGITALELSGCRIRRITRSSAEFHNLSIGLRPDILRPIQCPGDSGVGYSRHFGNILDGQFSHNIPFPQFHTEMFTSP